MSLYNRLFQENEDAMALLGMISCTRDMFQRYRDVFLNVEGNVITVLTRLGGGNRKDYQEVFDAMKCSPYYIRDYDDVFDETYCYFDFSVPEKYKKTCKMMAPKEEWPGIKAIFEKEIAESKIPGSNDEKRMDQIAASIFGALEAGYDPNDEAFKKHFRDKLGPDFNGDITIIKL